MHYEIRHDELTHRFIADFGDGPVAEVNYCRTDSALDIQRTYVPPERRHHQVGERIVTFAMDFAREHGLRVIPTCPFVHHVVRRNPRYQDLIPRPAP
jgi:predicted GNAT family acetyltransferase